MFRFPSICLQRATRIVDQRWQPQYPCVQTLFPKNKSISIRLLSYARPLASIRSPSPCLRPYRFNGISIMQIRRYSRRRPARPIVTNFPNMTTMPLNPLYKSKVFWGGIGFAGLLFLSPIPGWILLGGIGYGFYRLFRYLRSAQDVLFGARNGLLSTDGDASSLLDTLFSRDPHTKQIAAK